MGDRCIDSGLHYGTSFTTQFLYLQGEHAGAHWLPGWVRLRASLDALEKSQSLTLPGLEFRPLSCPARSQSLRLLRYPWSCSCTQLLDTITSVTSANVRIEFFTAVTEDRCLLGCYAVWLF
jgi:hypothetical protein